VQDPSLERTDDYYIGRFIAMSSPCEVLIDTDDHALAAAALEAAEREARRIDEKFSRYRPDNLIHRINHARGKPVEVDPETALLIDYSMTCYEVSDGMFDVTSGVLRKVWTFDGSDRVPTDEAVREVMRNVGMSRVTWKNPTISMPEGMEIDLGGCGKEYAVDRAAALVAGRIDRSFLVNFGGDIYASGPRRGDRAWVVGIDDPDRAGQAVLYRIDLERGGCATSGNARRYVIHKGKRLSHILNPKTGWPVEGAPRSVTVLAGSCLEAGTLSTLACLQGPRAEEFLREQGVEFRIL
jgi:thiamine biosynthesis lipoprotein